MSKRTQRAMREATERAGGRIDEATFLEETHRIIIANGGDTSMESLKKNAFTRSRLNGAGVERVTIGTDKQIWLSELAERAAKGEMGIGGGTAIAAIEPATEGDFGVFHGVARADPEQWPQHLRHLIPEVKGFVESPRGEFRHLGALIRRSLAGDMSNCHLNAEGPTGCGKSLMAMEMFAHLNWPVIRINMSDGVSEETLLGRLHLEDGNVSYLDGVLVEAMENGIPIICDEINAMRDNTSIAMFSAMDSGYVILPEDNNRVVRAKEGFMVIGTMNPNYAGTNEQNEAFRNRFSRKLVFDYLPEDLETEVIQSQSGFTNHMVASQLVKFANDLRDLKKMRKGITSDTSTRALVQVLMDLRDGFSITEALDENFVGNYGERERETVQLTARARLSDY